MIIIMSKTFKQPTYLFLLYYKRDKLYKLKWLKRLNLNDQHPKLPFSYILYIYIMGVTFYLIFIIHLIIY